MNKFKKKEQYKSLKKLNNKYMSVFILSGGNTSPFTDIGKYTNFGHSFWRAIAIAYININSVWKDKSSNGIFPKGLIIPFAKPEIDDSWENDLTILNSRFAHINPHIHCEFKLATKNPKIFKKELQESNIIIVPGGDGDLLQENISNLINISNLKIMLKNKVVAGASAGANLWSKSYYSNDNQAIMEGFGVLDIKTFCHYSSEKFEALNLLFNHEKQYKTIPIAENEWVLIKSNI